MDALGTGSTAKSDALWLRTTSDAVRPRWWGQEPASPACGSCWTHRAASRLAWAQCSPRASKRACAATPATARKAPASARSRRRYHGDGITIELRTLQGSATTARNHHRGRGATIAHDDTAYEEWGASGSIRIDPGTAGRGLSLTITPTWGSAASEAEQLWSATRPERTRAQRRVRSRTAPRRRGRLRSQSTARIRPREMPVRDAFDWRVADWWTRGQYRKHSPTAARALTLRTGLRWNASQSATLGLEATNAKTAGQTPRRRTPSCSAPQSASEPALRYRTAPEPRAQAHHPPSRQEPD